MYLIKRFSILLILVTTTAAFSATEYHVCLSGSDDNPGTAEAPFRTIGAAAKLAMAGDTVTVHAGTYREWVAPPRGGFNDFQRIVYRAAEGDKVIIKGSEVIRSWEKVSGTVWKVTLDNDFFGEYNPYREIIRGDWLSHTYGRDHHTGEVYLNGKSLYEIDSLEKVMDSEILEQSKDPEGSLYQWYTESDSTTTTIYANFHGADPNEELVEINVRPAVFFPKKTGVNYITVRGFHLYQAATQWAPPTAEQFGLIGPNWSKGWIIEDNVISDSKCTGIILGKEWSSGHNLWTDIRVKHGTQREREAIFNALEIGWSKNEIGSHTVRRNVIKNCEQAGIAGHLGGVFSKIYGNHIYNIHRKKQFHGAEVAGIKLHAPIDTLIENNLIHDTFKGIWMDWQSQGTRVSRNIIFRSEHADFMTEVNHGPMVVDNNIFMSRLSILNLSQGTAYLHNLIGGNVLQDQILNRFTPYHYQHSTRVAGLMTIQGGDDRYFNNVFASTYKPVSERRSTGLDAYNGYPIQGDDWITGRSVDDYAKHKFPVFIASNLYFNLALPFEREEGSIEDRTFNPQAEILEENGRVYLQISINSSFESVDAEIITSENLGIAFQPEVPFVNVDGSDIRIDTDILGSPRDTENPMVGPLENLAPGKSHKIRIW